MKYDVVFLIVVYGCDDLSSVKTLTTIRNNLAPLMGIKVKISIWNNGPKYFIENSKSELIAALINSGVEVSITEDLSNCKLSKLYNDFHMVYDSRLYVYLDHDSDLNEFYINELTTISDFEVGVPVVTCNNNVESPFYITVSMWSKYYSAIGSGLVVGKYVLDKLKLKYGNAFDEKYLLYGVDSSFFLRLSQSNLMGSVKEINGFDHDLSRLAKGKPSKFRIAERSGEIALTTRYYFTTLDRVFMITRVLIKCVKDFILGRKELSAAIFLKTLISGNYNRE
ncbi:hypothetical protein [Vibrio splendidus]|uniref:hypothetical protein n=1 Tax=Vibrio splendidus TaxID=29497 RepID=UPI00223646E2|nr:hypothetical protein [Vibrio splendidus]MCW4442360.1 hypothetical protein [Vibrio splendidus]